MFKNLYKNLLNKKEALSVIGLGYVGLPIADAFAKKINVIGFDVNDKKIQQYKKGIDATTWEKYISKTKTTYTKEERMKNYIVRALRRFYDTEEDAHRTKNEEFNTTKKRYEDLKKKGLGELVGILYKQQRGTAALSEAGYRDPGKSGRTVLSKYGNDGESCIRYHCASNETPALFMEHMWREPSGKDTGKKTDGAAV